MCHLMHFKNSLVYNEGMTGFFNGFLLHILPQIYSPEKKEVILEVLKEVIVTHCAPCTTHRLRDNVVLFLTWPSLTDMVNQYAKRLQHTFASLHTSRHLKSIH